MMQRSRTSIRFPASEAWDSAFWSRLPKDEDEEELEEFGGISVPIMCGWCGFRAKVVRARLLVKPLDFCPSCNRTTLLREVG